jgi:hypothetical protein
MVRTKAALLDRAKSHHRTNRRSIDRIDRTPDDDVSAGI